MSEFRKRSDCCHVDKSGRNRSSVAGYVVSKAAECAVRMRGFNTATPLEITSYLTVPLCGPDSSVGIVTGYGLDGSGIESRCRRDFPHPSRVALRPTQPPVQWVPGLSQG